jgi:hypothetical protein
MTDFRVSKYDTPVTWPDAVPTIVGMERHAELTKRRAVDLCRIAAMLCRSV